MEKSRGEDESVGCRWEGGVGICTRLVYPHLASGDSSPTYRLLPVFESQLLEALLKALSLEGERTFPHEKQRTGMIMVCQLLGSL